MSSYCLHLAPTHTHLIFPDRPIRTSMKAPADIPHVSGCAEPAIRGSTTRSSSCRVWRCCGPERWTTAGASNRSRTFGRVGCSLGCRSGTGCQAGPRARHRESSPLRYVRPNSICRFATPLTRAACRQRCYADQGRGSTFSLAIMTSVLKWSWKFSSSLATIVAMSFEPITNIAEATPSNQACAAPS